MRSLAIAVLALAAALPGSAQAAPPERIELFLDAEKKVRLEFLRVKPGTFSMGDPSGEANETPHEVTITKDYWLMKTELTQAAWIAVMGANPSTFKGSELPVENVSWADAQDFLRKLNEKAKDQIKNRQATLPTEAEWEYAARAKTGTRWYFGIDETPLPEHAWFAGNSGQKTHPVGTRKPNPWGFHDLYGGVWEWCQDWMGDLTEKATDPGGPKFGTHRVRRGGAYTSEAQHARSSFRGSEKPDARSAAGGLRVAIR